MIKLFKHIRKSMIKENRTSKYLLYALGEIILVVIGILIALSINTWNEENEDKIKERSALEGIKSSLNGDLNLYEDIYQKRFDRKKRGIDFLIKASYESLKIPDDTLMRYFRNMGTDIYFRLDNGPYDALKSSGFELIRNKKLRKEIINTYEVVLPAYAEFINGNNDDYTRIEQEYRKELLTIKIVKNDNSEYWSLDVFKVSNLLQNPSFLELLDIEISKYYNYINRMKSVKQIMKSLIEKIDQELQKSSL